MKDAGFDIVQVYSRSEEHAQDLANRLECNYTVVIQCITRDADIYIFSVKDDALPGIIRQTPANDGLWLHTAGSISIDVFKGYSNCYGVIYPLQTLSKHRKTDFGSIPLFVEGNTRESEADVLRIALALSGKIRIMSSEKRRYLHLAAVFACNFTNHLYAIATAILEEQDIDSQVILPLVLETANKLRRMTPENAQTGPAIRYDKDVIDSHLAMLDDEDLREIYLKLSENIHKTAIKQK
jgi:predicted short-subunit dehydrogenase-like oxidoreductase (DUF2520 family)